MFELLGIPPQALFGQLLLGLINGAFYAMLSLGLAVIFGLLNLLGIGYWPALIIAPLAVGAFSIVLERVFLRWMYKLDHLYGLLLTFGLALIIEGLFRQQYGSSGQPYAIPAQLT